MIVAVAPRNSEEWPKEDPQWKQQSGVHGTTTYGRNGKVAVYRDGVKVFEGSEEEFKRRGGANGF
jgi:hypothetical protein